MEVLRRIAAGQNTATMVREMKVTPATLRTYVKNVLGKLGAHSRLEAANLASGRIVPDLTEPDGNESPFARLTPREREVLIHFTAGTGLREVAEHLHMAPKTVNTHLQKIRSKLGVHSTLEAVALARYQLQLELADGQQQRICRAVARRAMEQLMTVTSSADLVELLGSQQGQCQPTRGQPTRGQPTRGRLADEFDVRISDLCVHYLGCPTVI
jgi:DNA-binding CsgD family transcriptional regulator